MNGRLRQNIILVRNVKKKISKKKAVAIKLIKMRSGEDIVGEVSNENTEYLKVSTPVVLMLQQNSVDSKVQMGMAPWQPFSRDKEFEIPRSWIVTISNPAEDIANGYRKMYGSGIEIPNTAQLLVG